MRGIARGVARALALSLAIVLSACASTDHVVAPQPVPTELLGSWDWVSTRAGVSGDVTTPASTGKRMEMRITAASRLETYVDDVLTSAIDFRLVLDTVIPPEGSSYLIVPAGASITTLRLILSNANQLTVNELRVVGSSSQFVRHVTSP
jgi:hypothetical protein